METCLWLIKCFSSLSPSPHSSLFLSSLLSSVLPYPAPRCPNSDCCPADSLIPLHLSDLSHLVKPEDWRSPTTCLLVSLEWCTQQPHLPGSLPTCLCSLRPTAHLFHFFKPYPWPVSLAILALFPGVDHCWVLLPFRNTLLLAFGPPPFPALPFPILADPFQSSVLVLPLLPDCWKRSSSRLLVFLTLHFGF